MSKKLAFGKSFNFEQIRDGSEIFSVVTPWI
jgi:hypothetical protein